MIDDTFRNVWKMYLMYAENEYYHCQFWGVHYTLDWPSEKWHLGQSKLMLNAPLPLCTALTIFGC
jgi:hypothetical protein